MDINIKLIFVILASLILTAGYVLYFRDILAQKTKPHAYSWLIWAITYGIATAGVWYGGGGWGAISMSLSVVLQFLVFLFSLRYGTRNITKGDTAVLMLALLTIFIWLQLDNPFLAILLVSIIDGSGYWPSIRKTYAEPWTETLSSWVLFTSSYIFTILSLKEYNFLTLFYIIIITLANITLIAISLARRKVVSRHVPI